VLSRIQAMQSQTDYASMIGESGVSVNGLRHAPHSLHARRFVVQPGMHHVEDLEKDEERKLGGVNPDVKSQRLEELKMIDEGLKKKKAKTSKKLFGELCATSGKHAGGLGTATRTLQPIKDFNLGSLMQGTDKPVDKIQEEGELKKKLSLAILQTHRFFSDLDDSKEEEKEEDKE